jgi:hypothetical protein
MPCGSLFRERQRVLQRARRRIGEFDGTEDRLVDDSSDALHCGWNGQHRNVRAAKHFLGHGSQEERLEPTPAVRAHHEEIGAPVFGVAQNLPHRTPLSMTTISATF